MGRCRFCPPGGMGMFSRRGDSHQKPSKGTLRALLTSDQMALNFLQRLSGIATMTAELVELVRPYPCQWWTPRKLPRACGCWKSTR